MKPVALLLAALLAVAAVFVFLDPDSGAPDDGRVDAAEARDAPSRGTDRRSTRADVEPPPLAPIPPADEEAADDADVVDLEAGSPETGLFGQVLTPTGSTLADALVTVYRVEGRSLLDERRIRIAEPAHTDADGVFRVVGLKGGDDYLLTVEHGAFASAEVRGLEVEADRLRQVPDVRLQSGVEITGVVIGPDRRPVEGAVIQAISVGDRRRRVVRQVLTDEGGGYGLAGLAPGAYEVVVSADGLETVRSSALPLLADKARKRFDATLAEAKAIAGVVTTPDGRPLDGAKVTARRLRGTGPSFGSDRTGADGAFDIGGLGDGAYNVVVERNGFIARTEYGVAAPKKKLRITLMPTVGVSGKVRDPDGEAVSSFFVRAWRVTPQGRLSEPMGDPRKVRSNDGSYTLDGFTPGTYKVEAFVPGYAPSLSRKFEVKRLYVHGINVRMAKGATLTGVVTDAAGRALEGATVRLLSHAFRPGPMSEMLYDDSQRLGRCRTDETGRFRFEGLKRGEYQLEVSAKDHRKQYERDIRVAKIETLEVGPLMLTPGGHLKGTVVDRRNVPTNGARVTLSTTEEGVVAEVRADDDGSFEFRHLAPGAYKINAAGSSALATSDDIFTQALKSLKGGLDVTVVEGQTIPVTLYVE
ncbi:MAG: carboxypeptidase regulatory-like domain-containing protein [Planctomycetota bacterium JB042]